MNFLYNLIYQTNTNQIDFYNLFIIILYTILTSLSILVIYLIVFKSDSLKSIEDIKRERGDLL
jgi:hypothetical protein